MKALIVSDYGGPEVLGCIELPMPCAAPGEALVRVRASGIVRADITMRAGAYPGGAKPPYIPGSEFVGEIVQAAEGDADLTAGTRVIGLLGRPGACAEYVAVPTRWLRRAPEQLSDDQAAGALGSYLSAEVALRLFGNLVAGRTVLINGAAGTVGIAACQLARASGAVTIGTAGSEAKLRRLNEFGADLVISYASPGWADEVLAATGGRGVDLAIEMVGGDVLSSTIDCVAAGGRLVCVGAASGRGSSRIRLNTLFQTNITIGGFTLGKLWRDHQDLLSDSIERVLGSLGRDGVLPVIAASFPIEQAAEAHRMMEEPSLVGRVILCFPR